MFKTGRLDLEANRWEPFVHVIDFVGFDFGSDAFTLEVRDRKDGGFLRAALHRVDNVGTEGVTLVNTANTEGVVTSTISIRINEPNIEAMNVATEAGDDGLAWWDLQISPAGGNKFRALEGKFIIKAGVSGSGS